MSSDAVEVPKNDAGGHLPLYPRELYGRNSHSSDHFRFTVGAGAGRRSGSGCGLVFFIREIRNVACCSFKRQIFIF